MSRPRIGPVVLASMAAGPVVALALVLGPLGGATEPVITGGISLAFAVAWALLAVASAAWTDQPQRWAAVPAVLFAVAGGACLLWPAGIPHRGVELAVPAVALGLVGWMILQARATLRSRARRRVLYPVFGAMALAAVATMVETVREGRDRTRLSMHGQLVDVGGRRLHVDCSGTGSPTVVLVPGAGETSSVWAWIAPEVARDARICTFDRAGRAWSDAAPGAQDGIAIVSDLHAALHGAGIEEPVVLVGHSFGGLYARVYASRYPAEVAGMVLLDATHPEMFTRLASYPAIYEGYRRLSALFPTLARLGIGRIAYRSNVDNLPALVRAEQLAWWSTPGQARSQRDEWAEAPLAMKQAGELRSIGGRPLVVVTAGRDAQARWMPLQEELLRLSSRSVHRVATNTTHMGLVDTEAGAAVSIWAIRQAVAMVRDDAEDVQQEVWLGVYRNLGGLANPAAFRTWLFQATRHRALGSVRRRVREGRILGEMADSAPDRARGDQSADRRAGDDRTPAPLADGESHGDPAAARGARRDGGGARGEPVARMA